MQCGHHQNLVILICYIYFHFQKSCLYELQDSLSEIYIVPLQSSLGAGYKRISLYHHKYQWPTLDALTEPIEELSKAWAENKPPVNHNVSKDNCRPLYSVTIQPLYSATTLTII